MCCRERRVKGEFDSAMLLVSKKCRGNVWRGRINGISGPRFVKNSDRETLWELIGGGKDIAMK